MKDGIIVDYENMNNNRKESNKEGAIIGRRSTNINEKKGVIVG